MAIAAMATQAGATTVNYTTTSETGIPGGGGINYWFFSGSGSLSFADGLADGNYTNPNVLTSFNQTTTFYLNINNPNPPPPPTLNIAAATWTFGLSDITNFSLFIVQGIPEEATFTLGPKLPASSLPGFVDSKLTYSFNSYLNDPKATFYISNGVNGLRLTGDLDGTVVPEPSTWALMLVGFGMVGAAMRRRSRQRVSVSYA